MDEPLYPPLPGWIVAVLALVAVLLVPWTIYLTVTLPSRHLTAHYDVAWVGFDVALIAALALTTLAAVRRTRWLVPLAAATGTMLVCDAWFDIVTSQGAGEVGEAIAEAIGGELPLAALCAFIVVEEGRFLRTLARVRRR